MAIAARMNPWDFGGRRYHPFVSFSASHCTATMGRIASAVCNLVATLLKTPARLVWSCGSVLVDVDKLISEHWRNQTHAGLSARRDSRAEMTCGDLIATSWRKAKMLSQLSAMVANISEVAFFFFPIFFFVYSSTSLSSLLYFSSLSPSLSSPSSALSVMERANILRSSSAVVSPSRISASAKNGGRRTALSAVQS